MKKLLVAILLSALSYGVEGAVVVKNPSQRKQLIDDGWQFRLTADDKGAPVAGEWRGIDLPHDWSIEADFDSLAAAGNDGGYLPAGRGSYRKILRVNAADTASRTALYLEGAYMNAAVSVNDHAAGMRPYGYSSVIYDITPYLRAGDNEIEIDVDNSMQKNCRWYSGSGIYRHVWLLNTPAVSVAPWSLFVTTPQVAESASTVSACFRLDNHADAPAGIAVRACVRNASGAVVAESDTALALAAGASPQLAMTFAPARYELWSPENPALYTLRLQIETDKGEEDTVEQTFGVRSMEFSAEKGFLLNGRPVLLNGGCVHHDNGLLGARSYDAAEYRKARLLKEAGFNAVRTSHNPPSPAFLDACDRLGLLVIDEAFDGWREAKNAHDYAGLFDSWWEADIESMVLRDRNHPSVMCWSIGNEVIERKKIEVVSTARKLAEKCRELDPTRPVTSALASWDSDWEIYDPLAAEHEITGYNYMIHKADTDHARVPDRVMWQTESYPRDAFSNWTKVADNSYIIGDFVWTAIDYLGESGIGRHYYEGESEGEHYHRNQWPWHAAYCGDIDLTGERKPVSHYRDMLYNPGRKLYMAVLEPDGYYGHIRQTQWGTAPASERWTWRGHEGQPVQVEVYSHYDRVRLYINDRLAGEQPTGRSESFRAVFTVAYEPGTLRAAGVGPDGRESEETCVIETAGEPYAIRLCADRTELEPDNQDLAYVAAEIVDRDGRVVPDASHRISFAAKGTCDIIATGSADIKDTEGYTRHERNAWRGRAMAVVKSDRKSGTTVLTATAPGLHPAHIKIKAEKNK